MGAPCTRPLCLPRPQPCLHPHFPAWSSKRCWDAPNDPISAGSLCSWTPEPLGPLRASVPPWCWLHACLPPGCGVKFQEGSSPLESSPWLASAAPLSSVPAGALAGSVVCWVWFSTWRSVQKLHSDSKSKSEGTRSDFPGSPVVKLPLPMRGYRLIPGKGGKIPHTLGPKNQNFKKEDRSNIVTNSIKTLKMVHDQKKKKKSLKKSAGAGAERSMWGF